MSSLPELRLARADERPLLEDLQRRASLHGERYRADLLEHPDAIELPDGPDPRKAMYVVCETGDTIVGFCVVLPRTDGQAELDGLFVDPETWRHGLGRLLVRQSARLARERCADTLHVVANPDATAFYEKCGFVLAGMEQTRFGPACTMVLSLGPNA